MNVKSGWKKTVAMLIVIVMVAAVLPANIAYAASANKLTAKYSSEGGIVLKWEQENNGHWYKVYKAAQVDGKAGPFKEVITFYCEDVDPRPSYEDYKIEPGKTYYYKVKILSEGERVINETNTVKYTIKLKKPQARIYTEIASGKPVISWEKIKGASKYQVYRSTSKNGNYSRVITTTKLSIKNNNAAAGKTYYYKIKAIAKNNSSANSDFSAVVFTRAMKADQKLATAVKNTSRKKVSTLNDTLSLVSKVGIKYLPYFDGGALLCLEGKLKVNDVYDFSKIKKAGGVVKAVEGVRGDPFFTEIRLCPQKNGAKYRNFTVETYGMNIHKVKKYSTQKACINNIKGVVHKYYPSERWTVTVEKYNASNKKFNGEIKDMKECYNYYLDATGYGKYKANTYILKIKNKKNSKQQSWTYVTAVPTL